MEQAISYDNNIDLFKEYQETKSISLRNEIALKNKKLIYIGMKGLYSPNTNDIEELEQEAFICLLKAVETFDVSKGFKFSTYAVSCIKAITRKRLDYSIDLSLDEPIQNQDGENLSMVDTLEDERVDIVSACVDRYNRNKFKKILSEEEYKILDMFYIKEMTIKYIAQELELTAVRVQSIKQNAEKKIYNSKYFQDYREEALYYDEITYIKAYDYSSPKVQTSNISNPVLDTVLKLEKRDNDIFKNVLLGK